ncbi:unnamed protein product [Eruca vesicaria subsp. sativa]|uniref:Uncharacterized protein n=1 Tax=Eruca vesicaria subsp. sativa TaxID=29727 RepID=A0ABC8JIE1_ERUVS|nr:unnamed protein product [Eruca vesicaria subsp. sativa]
MSVVLTKSEIIGGSVDGTVRTFDLRLGREMSDNLGQLVNFISISNDGNCVLAGCLDSTLRLLDRTTGSYSKTIKVIFLRFVMIDLVFAQVVWITGANQGIGEALAKQFASLVAKLILSDRNEAELVRLKYAPEHVRVFRFALASTSIKVWLRDVVAAVVTHFRGGGVDYLIHNAAYELPKSNAMDASEENLKVTSVSYHPKEDCMLTSSVDGTVCVSKI